MRPYVCRSCLNHLQKRVHLPQQSSQSRTLTTKITTTNTSPPSNPTAEQHDAEASQPKVSPSTLSHPPTTSTPLTNTLHTLSTVPDQTDLLRSAAFFQTGNPRLLFSVPNFRLTPLDSASPEIAVLGRSNVGKSSLLNAVFSTTGKRGSRKNAELVKTGSKPGKTRTMNGFLIGTKIGGRDRGEIKGQLTVLDMPGYGYGSRADWGTEIVKYLRGRKQLRRTFLLIDATHGLKSTDHALLSLLRKNYISHQIVLSKIDTLIKPLPTSTATNKNPKPAPDVTSRRAMRFYDAAAKILSDIRTWAVEKDGGGRDGRKERYWDSKGLIMEVLGCCAESKVGPLGIEVLRWEMLRAAGLVGVSGAAAQGLDSARDESRVTGEGKEEDMMRRERDDDGLTSEVLKDQERDIFRVISPDMDRLGHGEAIADAGVRARECVTTVWRPMSPESSG